MIWEFDSKSKFNKLENELHFGSEVERVAVAGAKRQDVVVLEIKDSVSACRHSLQLILSNYIIPGQINPL